MDLLPALESWLAPFAQHLTAPTFTSFLTIIAGWILCRRRTLTGALVAAAPPPRRHFSAYHRVFAHARWNLDAVGLALLGRILSLIPAGWVFLVLDDTLCRKHGRRMFGVGMHYDPLLTGRKLSNANQSLKSKGHCWVILGVVVAFPFRPGHYFCLPVLTRLFLNQKTAARHRQAYRSRPDLGRDLLALVCAHFPARQFHLLVDSAYAGQDTLARLPANCELTARWILNARLGAPPLPKPPGQRGPARKRGPALPAPQAMLNPRCPHVEVDVYGSHRTYRVATVQACLFTVPGRVLTILASEPVTPGGRRRPRERAAFYSTVREAPAEQVLLWYARRWSVEVTIHDAKGQLGLEQPQGWSREAVRRTTPTLLLLYSVVVLWFAQEGHRHWRPARHPWYRGKAAASFADMLAGLRTALLKHQLRRILRPRPWGQGLRVTLRTALRLIQQAA
jgi:hypothetical protein